MVVRFVIIGGIVNHYCSNFLFIIYIRDIDHYYWTILEAVVVVIIWQLDLQPPM